MKQFMITICMLIAAFSIVATEPSPILKSSSKLNIKKKRKASERWQYDTVKLANFTLTRLINKDSVTRDWTLIMEDRSIKLDSDPTTRIVYFNPNYPKYFHSSFNCNKIGEFRKLQEIPIKEFLKRNKSANICPECLKKDEAFYYSTKIVLEL